MAWWDVSMAAIIVCEEVTSGWKMIHVYWRYELLEKWLKSISGAGGR